MCEVISKLIPTWLLNWNGIPKSLVGKSERARIVGLIPPSRVTGNACRANERLGPSVAIDALAPDSPIHPAEASRCDRERQRETKSQFHGKSQFTNPSAW